MHDTDIEKTLTIDAELCPWLADAAVRFRYLYPNVHLSVNHRTVTLAAPSDRMASLVQDLMFCIYRQKIYSETLPLRTMLIEGVTGFASRSA
jgi:hypothetical protein